MRRKDAHNPQCVENKKHKAVYVDSSKCLYIEEPLALVNALIKDANQKTITLDGTSFFHNFFKFSSTFKSKATN
jgi:hypothetical protein